METVLILTIFQGLLGAFDVLYHHEFLEKLPWRKTAATELKLHGVRNFFYAVVFVSFGWVAWHGAWAWVLGVILAIEVGITLWDFVEEDLSRKLPATERISHTILALNYGAVLALFSPVLLSWADQPTGFSLHEYGWLSWVMALFAAGVFLWGMRDSLRGIRLSRPKTKRVIPVPVLDKPNQKILVAGGTGFIGTSLCQLLIEQGHDVTIITRSVSKAAGKFFGRVTLLEGYDRLKTEDRFDIVINLTGEAVAQRWTEKARMRIVQSRQQSIEALTNYLERAPHKPNLYIQSSAIGMYGFSDDKIFDEETALNERPQSYCEAICFPLEKSLDAIEKLGVSVCKLRIGLVMEKDGGFLSKLLFPHEFGLAGKVGHGRQWMSWIHRDDVIGLIYHVINHEEICGPLNATAPAPVRQKQFAATMGKVMRRPAFMPLPACVVALLFGEMGRELLLSGQKVLPKKALGTGYQFMYPHLDDALRAILK